VHVHGMEAVVLHLSLGLHTRHACWDNTPSGTVQVQCPHVLANMHMCVCGVSVLLFCTMTLLLFCTMTLFGVCQLLL